ncbi:MAG: hypothetical protein DWQ19_10920 [Crenarchaeota archaeon]|nr:MAG: hypothetical protein DWQ19_10920 [Thermoproteota archaeon]
MSIISPTGKNLDIVISCDFLPHHNWMSFASWYSIYKNLPDAKVRILCKRTQFVSDFFKWTFKCKVPFIQYTDHYVFRENELKITPDVMAIDIYDKDALGPIDVRLEEKSTFITYLHGCGNFVLTEWIDTFRNPFGMTGRFFSNNLTVNEYRVLKLWEKCHKIYNATI